MLLQYHGLIDDPSLAKLARHHLLFLRLYSGIDHSLLLCRKVPLSLTVGKGRTQCLRYIYSRAFIRSGFLRIGQSPSTGISGPKKVCQILTEVLVTDLILFYQKFLCQQSFFGLTFLCGLYFNNDLIIIHLSISFRILLACSFTFLLRQVRRRPNVLVR